MDEAEEKIRQRRERIEQWRKEKALKDIAESERSSSQIVVPSLDESSYQVKPKWSLEDDDDEDEAETPSTVDVKAEEECKTLYCTIGIKSLAHIHVHALQSNFRNLNLLQEKRWITNSRCHLL